MVWITRSATALPVGRPTGLGYPDRKERPAPVVDHGRDGNPAVFARPRRGHVRTPASVRILRNHGAPARFAAACERWERESRSVHHRPDAPPANACACAPQQRPDLAIAQPGMLGRELPDCRQQPVVGDGRGDRRRRLQGAGSGAPAALYNAARERPKAWLKW